VKVDVFDAQGKAITDHTLMLAWEQEISDKLNGKQIKIR
jgi:hypothetical protein